MQQASRWRGALVYGLRRVLRYGGISLLMKLTAWGALTLHANTDLQKSSTAIIHEYYYGVGIHTVILRKKNGIPTILG